MKSGCSSSSTVYMYYCVSLEETDTVSVYTGNSPLNSSLQKKVGEMQRKDD